MNNLIKIMAKHSDQTTSDYIQRIIERVNMRIKLQEEISLIGRLFRNN